MNDWEMFEPVKYTRPALWKRILGFLGVKKYQINYVYGLDFAGQEDQQVEISGFKDADGVYNVTEFKVKDKPCQK